MKGSLILARQLLFAFQVGLTGSLNGSCIVPRMIYRLNALPVGSGSAAIYLQQCSVQWTFPLMIMIQQHRTRVCHKALLFCAPAKGVSDAPDGVHAFLQLS